MKILRLSVFILFFGCCSALAGELDSYYLQQFGELTSDSSKTTFKRATAMTVNKCGMPLRHNLKRDWKSLQPDTQQTLAKYLGPPVLAEPKSITSSGSHFVIHYSATGADAPPLTDNDNNGLPDWIEKVAEVFETVYAGEVGGMGYSPPKVPYHVYLQNMSYFGLTDSNFLQGQSATSYITIENDFAESGFQNSIPGNDSAHDKSVKALQITAAHEFHHAIQFSYNFFFEPWYAEATSTWMEDELYDGVNQLYDHSSNYLLAPETSLDIPGDGGYSRWIFNRSLAENHGQTVIRSIWERLRSTIATNINTNAKGDIEMLPVIDTVMKNLQSSLATEFSLFAKRLYSGSWTTHTDELDLFYQVPLSMATSFTNYPVNPATTPPATATLPHYAIKYFKFTPSALIANLTITVNTTTGVQTTLFRKTSVGINEVPVNPTGTGSNYSYTVDGFGTLNPGSEEVVLMAINTTAVDNHMLSFSSDGSSGAVTEPPTTPPQFISGTGSGSGGCFIATAAYGSYLHPEVMTLRNFRDKYLVTNIPGRAFVALYYRVSPPIADFIREHEAARFMVRRFLAPLIFAVKHLWTVAAVILLLAFAALPRGWRLMASITNTVKESRCR